MKYFDLSSFRSFASLGACAFICASASLPLPATSLHAAFEAVSPKLARVRNLPKQPMLRVLLAQEQEGLMVEAKGGHNIYDPYTGKKIETAFLKSSYYMYPTVEGVKWGQEFPGVFQILIVPDSSSAAVSVNGTQYPGAVAFYQVDDALAAVNWVSLEDLTKSILSSTFLPNANDQKEAIAAYAIAIRSLAYQKLLHSKNAFWDLKMDNNAYRGNTVERLDKPFLDAMKISQDIVLISPSGYANSGEDKALSEGLAEIMKTMPVEEVQKMAESGKDARRILEQFYPGQILTLVETPKIPQGHPYSR